MENGGDWGGGYNGGHSFIVWETARPGKAAAQVEDLTSWRPARSQWPKLAAVTAGQNRGWQLDTGSCPPAAVAARWLQQQQQGKASLSNYGLVHLGTFLTHAIVNTLTAGQMLGTVFNFCQISHRVELLFFSCHHKKVNHCFVVHCRGLVLGWGWILWVEDGSHCHCNRVGFLMEWRMEIDW